MLNSSDDDFASPIVFKKSKPKTGAPNTRTNAIKSNKTKKKPKKKQVTLEQLLIDNTRITDTNEEHLQMALALSKSTSEMLNEEKDDEWTLNLAMNKPDIKRTLLEFGFKSDRSKMNVENKLNRIALGKNKKSKFRFITPVLLLRTDEERQSLIESKISIILSRNTEAIDRQEVQTAEVSSDLLNGIKCSECSIFRLNHYLDECPRDNFKVSKLGICWSRGRCGSLLKDWKQIALRDHTPERTVKSKSFDLEKDVDSDTESVRASSERYENIMKPKSPLMIVDVLSPDLFDDTILVEKSIELETSTKIKKNLSSIFSQEKTDSVSESSTNEIVQNNERISDSCQLTDNGIYHFDGYNTDDDILCLSSSSDDGEDGKSKKISLRIQRPQNSPQKNDSFPQNKSGKYHISSSDDEQEMYEPHKNSNVESTKDIGCNSRISKIKNTGGTPDKEKSPEISLRIQKFQNSPQKNDSFSQNKSGRYHISSSDDEQEMYEPHKNANVATTKDIGCNSRISPTEITYDTPDREKRTNISLRIQKSQSPHQKNNSFSQDNSGKYHISSSDDDEQEINEHYNRFTNSKIMRNISNYSRNSITENTPDKSDNFEFNESGIRDSIEKNKSGIQDSNEQKSLDCNVENAFIVLDSDEEPSISIHNSNLEDQKETGLDPHDFADDLSNDNEELMEIGYNSNISDLLHSELPEKLPPEENRKTKKISEIKHKSWNENDSIRKNKDNDSKEISSNKYKFNKKNNIRWSASLSCSNLNQISYLNRTSMNITEHIEEILACSYNQIDSLPLSDVDSSTNLNQDSLIISKNSTITKELNQDSHSKELNQDFHSKNLTLTKEFNQDFHSNSTVTKELNDILTEKNESLNKNSLEPAFTDSSSEIICISDDELNYSCTNNKIDNETLFKKYSSFTETPKRNKASITRHKSESFVTPKRNMIIKTDNITPMIDYDALNTPDIVKELDKFGLKPLKRKRGVNLLKYIYETTHPTVSQVNETERVSKRKKSNECTPDTLKHVKIQECTSVNTFKHVKIQELFNQTWIESIPEAEFIFEKKRSAKFHTCQIPLQIVWHNFLSENPHIYDNILRYEPVQVEEIHKMLKGQGFNFHLQDLITFLDRKCITIRVAQNHKNKS